MRNLFCLKLVPLMLVLTACGGSGSGNSGATGGQSLSQDSPGMISPLYVNISDKKILAAMNTGDASALDTGMQIKLLQQAIQAAEKSG